ncbi:unnamed protein product [Euphydryas editha]|uniref:Hemolin n=1 Tax=Euphydryas editha TaxID=104508 RepID=A0AAU9UL62_EUPED|nr:unnamed protein product [Euphydryas editha]
MYLIYIFAVVLVNSGKAANVNKHMKLLEIENQIQTNGVKLHSSKRFITIIQRPGVHTAHRPGTVLELTCEALAAPAPSIHWFKNDAPVYKHDKESNEVIDTNPTSLARVASTLLISRTEESSEYTCLIVAGLNKAHASTIVYSTDGSTEITERSKLIPLSPKILVSYKLFVDTIGSNIVLPCKVKGHPRPQVVWTDNNGEIVKNSKRMKVLRSGELVISPFMWSDMGEFACKASNIFGSTEIKTFVYPARVCTNNY